MADRRILVCGGGIAGLTLGILLKESGYDPVVIEREPSVRTDGYMMDFFGTGWDVAERMGLTDALRAFRYPIDAIAYVDKLGQPYASMPIERVAKALDGRYVYLRRPDLERVLFERARAREVEIVFDRTIRSIDDTGGDVRVVFDNGSEETFALVFGADGVHSRVRELVFGPEAEFERFIGGYVAAFHMLDQGYGIGRALKLYETTDGVAAFYPLGGNRLDATYVFRHARIDLPRRNRLAFVRRQFAGAGWIAEGALANYERPEPVFFDSLTQIVMPRWHRGRVALLGDAAGCLTLLAGQGSHMAMAGAYVLTQELVRNDGNYTAAFTAYGRLLKPAIAQKQRDAETFARYFMPSRSSSPWLRRLVVHLLFSRLGLRLAFGAFGAKSALADYE